MAVITTRPRSVTLSELARRRALEMLDRNDPPLRVGAVVPRSLAASPHLAFLNRHWVVEPVAANGIEPPGVLGRLMRAIVAPVWDRFARLAARATIKVLIPYFLHEREFFAHLVRFSNETATGIDERARELDRLADAVDQRAAALREDLLRLRDQLEAEIERLHERTIPAAEPEKR